MNNRHIHTLCALLLVFAPALVLSGCGGGGGGSSSSRPSVYPGSISGKIVDTSGTPAATAVVSLDGIQLGPEEVAGTTATLAGGASFSEGGYEIQSVPPGFHIITVSTTVNSVTYTGSTQIGLPNIPDNALTNANIIISPNNEQASASGVVTINGQPVGGAVVYFQSAFTNPSGPANPASSATGSVSLQAITAVDGSYSITNLPVLNSTGGPRVYTVSAAYPTGSSSTEVADGTPLTEQFTAGQTATAIDFNLPGATSNGSVTPTLNYVQSFTQPDEPSAYTPAAVAASPAKSVYTQIRAKLSPQFAQLTDAEQTSSVIKHLSTAVVPHATPSEYTIEMDLFFSLPGDTASTPSAARSSLSGFQIDSNAGGSGIEPYDFLQDPLANFYTDPDLNASQIYFADTQYEFEVQSVGSDGVTLLGSASNSDGVAPLAFVNVSQPGNPSDNGGTVSTLANGSNIEWSTIDPLSPSTPNHNVANYYVYIYSTFPGVTTAPIYTSSAIAPTGTTQQTFAVPGSSLTANQQYWLVVAATSTNDSSSSSAISVSQILPFVYGG